MLFSKHPNLIKMASGQNNTAMINALQAQLKCYQAGSPFRAADTAS